MNEQFVTKEEMNRHAKVNLMQVKTLDDQIKEIRNKIIADENSPSLAPKTKDLLAKQVQKMFKEIQFLHSEIKALKNKLEGKSNG